MNIPIPFFSSRTVQSVGIFLVLAGFTYSSAVAQDMEEGLELYEQQRYEEALEIFEEIEDSDEAVLFAGKSYLGMGEYLKANNRFNLLEGYEEDEVDEDILLEARYSRALAYFQLKLFGKSLDLLHEIDQVRPRTSVVNDARSFYESVLEYLTLNQRKEAFQNTDSYAIRYDLVETAMGIVDFQTARILVDQYIKATGADSTSEEYEDLHEQVADSSEYRELYDSGSMRAPNGTVYNIGVALPEFDTDDEWFSVSQGLYFGILLAAEEFNQRNDNRKAYIRFQNTGTDEQSAQRVVSDFAWQYSADAMIGPLFSEPALSIADYAEQYQIPMIAPLANSDTLQADNPYLYQANPTLSTHGRSMARYAVQELGMDTLAVLSERGSLGEASAIAFREEAEKLGAKVPYFFNENLQSRGYDISEYTKYLTTDSEEIRENRYHQLDGVYTPFTGQAASTLIDLLLIDMEAMESELPILGLPEWGDEDISEARLENRDIYFTEGYYRNTRSSGVEEFEEAFNERFETEANEYAMVGYDAADYLLRTLERIQNPGLLKNALKDQDLYEGLIYNIDFEGTHVNQQVKVFQMDEEGIEQVDF